MAQTDTAAGAARLVREALAYADGLHNLAARMAVLLDLEVWSEAEIAECLGRLDFALPAVFGGDDEFKMEGGSVGYYLDRKAAVLAYKRALHTASLLVFRGDGLSFPTARQDLDGTPAALRQERGFRALVWRQGELGYALVSDLNTEELVRLGARIASATK